MLQICGAAQQVHCIRLFAMQRQAAGADALEVEDVVDQADEAIALPMATSSIWASFSGRFSSTPPAIRPSAARSEVSGVRSSWLTVEMNSSFMRSSAAALGDIGEGDDRAADDPVMHELARDVFHREGGAVLAPEDLVVHAHRLFGVQRRLDRAVLVRIGRAVGLGVVDQLVRVSADNLIHRIAEHAGAGFVAEGEVAADIESPDAVAD